MKTKYPKSKKQKRVAGKSSKETVLILRTCDKDRCSHGGFVWPEEGEVAAPDWDPKAVCGCGLHGLLWGEGDASLLNWNADAKWLVAEVEADSIVDLGDKVKFPKANVIFCGDRVKATELVLLRGGKRVVGAVVSAGDYGTATAGDYGTATAGNSGTATAGNSGTATAGYCGTATAGTISILWWDTESGFTTSDYPPETSAIVALKISPSSNPSAAWPSLKGFKSL